AGTEFAAGEPVVAHDAAVVGALAGDPFAQGPEGFVVVDDGVKPSTIVDDIGGEYRQQGSAARLGIEPVERNRDRAFASVDLPVVVVGEVLFEECLASGAGGGPDLEAQPSAVFECGKDVGLDGAAVHRGGGEAC